MRIAVDYKPASSEAAMRGMGRYTQQQIREVLLAAPELDVYLFTHGPIPSENRLFDWTTFPNVHTIPVSVDGHSMDPAPMPTYEKVLAYSHRLQQLLKRHRIDLFHNTVPFMYPYYSAITVCPVITTFYDAIPLIFPGSYFGTEEQRRHYLHCMTNVSTSDHVIAISKSAAFDLKQYTGYSLDQISIAYPVIEGVFRPIERGDRKTFLKALAARFPAFGKHSGPFILSVTGVHRSKNAHLLVEAYTAVAGELGSAWKLVIVLPSKWAHGEFHRCFGDHPNVITLCDITDEELAVLYNQAAFVVQPSTYEGFGYPVAEAMHSGAAVITTRSSSLPEIAEGAAILVSPTDPYLMGAAILRLARDPKLRESLSEKALIKSQEFSDPKALGRATRDAYFAAVERTRKAPPRRSIAVWSSMPPLDCGVADYSGEFVKQLSQEHNVDVYVDGSYNPTPMPWKSVRFRHPKDYEVDDSPAPCIFQMGARNYQEYMFAPLRKYGGLVLLHDVSMALGFQMLAQSANRMAEFEDHIVAPDGAAALEAYARFIASPEANVRAAQEEFFQKHKLLQWIIDSTAKQLVHTPQLEARVLDDYPGARTAVVRMGWFDRLPGQRYVPLPAWRLGLGLGPDGICLGSFGIVDRVKRLHVTIEAFTELYRVSPTSVLLIVGRCYDDTYGRELKAQIQASPAGGRILMLDYAPPEAFASLMVMCDGIVNLRHPIRMGLSGVLVRALATGKPTVISDIDEWDSIPSGACLRVPVGGDEVHRLTGILKQMAASREFRLRYGTAARQWYVNEATAPVMVGDYMSVLREVEMEQSATSR